MFSLLDRSATRPGAFVLVAALALLSGCPERLPPGPAPAQVSPGTGPNDGELRVLITGEGLEPRLVTDFDDPSRTRYQSTFRCWLGDTELTDVQPAVGGGLHATVPAGLPAGRLALTVEDPLGRRGGLPDAFEVVDAAARPHALAITSAPQSLRLGACSAPLTFELRNSAGAAVTAPAAAAITFSGAQFSFFSDPLCATPIVAQTIPAGAGGATAYFRGTAVGTFDLSLGAPNLLSASQPQTVIAAVACAPQDPDGAPCDDANACTTGDRCQGGLCTAQASIACTPPSPCHDVGVCNPQTGACSSALKAEGASCEDGLSCTSGEVCRQGACGGATQFNGCQNVAPLACLAVSPRAVRQGQAQSFSAACSTDTEQAAASLEARFDFDGDSTFDTAFGPLSTTHTFPSAGVFRAVVEVRDDAGVSAFATAYAVAATAVEDVVVTTAADENDNAATPVTPGGTGLSLREALAHANTVGGNRVIRLDAGTAYTVGAAVRVTANNVTLVGESGSAVSFTTAQGGGCLKLEGDGARVIGLHLQACPAAVLDITGSNALVADSVIGGTSPLRLGGQGLVFGPNNEVRGIAGDALRVSVGNVTVDGNRIHDNAGRGVALLLGAGSGHVIQRNFVYRNQGAGLDVDNNIASPQIRFNVFDSNGAAGVTVGNLSGAPAAVRNNLFTRNGTQGLAGQPASFGPAGPNLTFRNTAGPSAGNVDAGLSADPLFVAADGGDFRIRPESPAVNAGVDVGLDVNGPGAGNWNGSAPDLGGHESP